MTLPPPDAWPVPEPPRTSDLLADRAAATPDHVGVIDADASWTYAAFDDLVESRSVGLGPEFAPDGGRIGTLVGTGVAVATLAFATWRLGCALVPLDPRRDDETLASMAERADLDALVCEAATAKTAAAVAPRNAPVASVADLPDGDPAEIDREAGRPSEAADAGVDPDDEWLLPFTSGTTGRPKCVRLTGRNLLASATYSAARLDVVPDDRWLACLPPCHVGGIAPLVRSAVYGTTTVFQSAFDPDATARAIEAHRVTSVSLVPTMLRRLLDDGWRPPDRLRFVLLGGGPARPGLLERCERLGVPVCPTYGTTETASQVATATPETAFSNPGTVGPPLDGVDVAVVDDDGRSCDPGEAGEVVVVGPIVAPGYLDAAATDEAFRADGFHTGDLGYRDEAGHLWVEGRVDDLIRTGGETVRPATVADALRSHDGVAEAAVVGLRDPKWGERVAAAVVPVGDLVDETALREHCRDRLAGYEVPKGITVVEELPRTASGTVDRERLRALLTE